jgi:hypothetical protein
MKTKSSHKKALQKKSVKTLIDNKHHRAKHEGKRSRKKNKEVEDMDHPHEYEIPEVLKKDDDKITNNDDKVTNQEEGITKD